MTETFRSLFFFGRVLAVAAMRGITFPIKYVSKEAALVLQAVRLRIANLLFRPGFDPKNQLTIEQNFSNAELEVFLLCYEKQVSTRIGSRKTTSRYRVWPWALFPRRGGAWSDLGRRY